MVFLTVRVHPFPFRTRKLSSPVPTILVWRRTGKIGQCQHRRPQSFGCGLLLYLHRFPRRCDTMALPSDFRHGRRNMQIRCNLLRAADSYRQNIKMGGGKDGHVRRHIYNLQSARVPLPAFPVRRCGRRRRAYGGDLLPRLHPF